ncbi:MAG: trigger factor [Oscillospiraceae bacterium]|nr:trigger factor [Oscillospiraceae bacterium]
MSLVSSNKVETNRAELVIEVKGEVFTKAVDAAFRKNVKKIAVPGFRKGKAPRAMIEKVYGKGFFLEEAMNDLYPEAYTAAVDEADIVPVDMPEIEVMDLNDEGFTFKATVTTKPVATVGEYKGLTAEKGVAEVADEQLDDRIDQIRERYARVIAVEDRAAKLGDIAEIDFEGFKDGVAFDGGKGENHPLTLGSGSFIPGFEDQIVGHNIGDEFDVNVTFPEDYAEASLAGAPTVFKVKINAIKERQLPELDDEFAKDVSEFDTFEEYKADLKAKMLETAQAQVDAEFENKLLEQVVAGMTVELPDCMIESRINELVQDFAQKMSYQGLKLDDFLKYTGETEENFRNNFREQAEKQVKTRLAMEAVAAAEGFTASDEDVEAEYANLAEIYHMDVEKIKAALGKREIAEDIVCRKAIEVITSSANGVAAEAPKKKTAKKAAKAEEAEGEDAPKKKTTKKAAAKTEEAEGEAKPKRTRKTKTADAE